MSSKHYFFPGIIVLLVAIPQLISQIVQLIKFAIAQKTGIKTRGVVKELFYEDEEITASRMLVHFIAENGKTYEITSTTGSIFYKKLEGKEIDVVYKKNQPENAFLVIENRSTGSVLLIIFVFLTALGIYLILNSF
jgi:hypothetical protein